MTAIEDALENLQGEQSCLQALLRLIEASPPRNPVQQANAGHALAHRRGEVERARQRLEQAQDADRSRPLTPGAYASRQLLDSIEHRRTAV